MDHLKIIEQTFYSHQIAKLSDLKSAAFQTTDKYPNSVGVQFENTNFAGEIFYYSYGKMEYCEMEFMIFNSRRHKTKIIDKPNESELTNEISDFLTALLTGLKNSSDKHARK